MFEQDYILRLIRESARLIAKLVFNIDTPMLFDALAKDANDPETLNRLLTLIDNGEINEAENHLFLLTEEGEPDGLRLALLFYLHLNEKSDKFLRAHDYSRDEVRQGLNDVARQYGLNDITGTFK